jgi:ribose transport system permease protein
MDVVEKFRERPASKFAMRRSAHKFESWWMLGVLAILIVVFTYINPPAFMSVYNFRNILADATALLVIAVGMTFVIATAGIDLSVGAILVFSQVVAVKVMILLGGEGWFATGVGIAVSIAVGSAWGLLNGMLVAYTRVPPMVATLGTMGMAGGAGLLMTGGVNIREGVPEELTSVLGNSTIGGVFPTVALVAVVIVIAAGYVLSATRFGLYTLGIGSNERALIRSGVATRPVLVKIYILSGTCAGLAGVIDVARFTTTTVGGHLTDNLNAVTAVVIGGTSLFGGTATITGTTAGVFIPAILLNGLIIASVPSFWQQIAVGAVLVVAVIIDQRKRNR